MCEAKTHQRIIMRLAIKIFLLVFVVQALYLKNETILENEKKNQITSKDDVNKSLEELTFDRVWGAYNGLRHKLDSALAQGHYTS